MPRHFWISASIALLVAAFALFALALPALYRIDSIEDLSADGAQVEVATYPVPNARGESIRDALDSVIFVLTASHIPGSRVQARIVSEVTSHEQENRWTRLPGTQLETPVYIARPVPGVALD